MDARTVNDLPPAATHDGAVRGPLAIELSKKSWIVAVNTPLSDKLAITRSKTGTGCVSSLTRCAPALVAS
jgi:hypothetical protein